MSYVILDTKTGLDEVSEESCERSSKKCNKKECQACKKEQYLMYLEQTQLQLQTY